MKDNKRRCMKCGGEMREVSPALYLCEYHEDGPNYHLVGGSCDWGEGRIKEIKQYKPDKPD
jgi:hypothetical protein